MKILFAVSNEKISDAVIKKYQREYKEIVSYKNVYYFNAILKELQKDKTYDRVVISEDLEPAVDNNYERVDKNLFERLDAISDEASDSSGNDIPIILICTDRRVKSEPLLVKLFGIGIYSALLGQDRSIDQVCKLIAKPRTKKEAKMYYRIDSEDVTYQSENESDVSEIEIQNILTHYKRLGKNEDKYIESFNNIAAQYTDSQLRVISKFLPLNVRAVLEAKSPKYQSIMTFKTAPASTYTPNNYQGKEEKTGVKVNFIDNGESKQRLTRPVVIPSSVNSNNVRKLSSVKKQEEDLTEKEIKEDMIEPEDEISNILDSMPGINQEPKSMVTSTEEPMAAAPKRRGRPKKVLTPEEQARKEQEEQKPKRRGRPRKNPVPSEPAIEEEKTEEPINLFNMVEEEPMVLPGIEEKPTPVEKVRRTVIPSAPTYGNEPIIPKKETITSFQNEIPNVNYSKNMQTEEVGTTAIKQTNYQPVKDIDNLLTRDKKLVTFVGTSKNGTSFLVNNVAELLASSGIKTAILDMTQNRNSYYIYTKNEEQLRKVAFNCFEGLRNGIAEGIRVNKNLTVYTALPEDEKNTQDYSNILATLVQNYSLVLIDCDFTTPVEYFKEAQEIYLVQSMDVLTIQPLTAFLRELKAKDALASEKIRIVINKELKVRSLTEKTIIGGMAFYNDPAMSFMTELFDREAVKHCIIPFEMQTYSKYLEGLVNCEISLKGYSKAFMSNLKELGNMVYPLITGKPTMQKKEKQYKPVDTYGKTTTFDSDMNRTLQQMKNRY